MFAFIAQAGLTTTGITFITELFFLFVSLTLLTVLSARMIVGEAVRYHFAQKAQIPAEMAPAITEYRQVA